MAQMTEALAHAILAGDGITRNEVEQLCHFFLRHSADLARLTAELERKQRECEGLRGALVGVVNAWEKGYDVYEAVEQARAALSAGEKDGHA